MRRRSFLSLAALPLAPSFATGRAAAQDAAPALTVVAGGLINPRGFAWDATGALVVGEAGTGGEEIPDEEVPPPAGPYRGGPTARVSRIEGGCPVTVADGLPSAVSATGEPIGVADVALVGDRLVALVGGGGPAHGNANQPAGLYELGGDGATLLVDLGDVLRSFPGLAEPPADADPDGFLYGMLARPAGDGVWIAERSGGQVLLVLLDGTVARIADLSADGALPTALAVDADGALHVGMFSAPPYAAGDAYVLKLLGANPLGPPERVWTGLTMVTGLAFGPDGALYATEFSAARDQPPFVVAGSGRVLRQTGPSAAEEVLTGLNLPTATHFGPDGALYVSLPAVGADGGDGIVVRADLAAALPIDAQAFDLAAPACTADAGAGQGSVEGAVPVEIVDFAFEPATVTVTVGTTVAWTNAGATGHTTTSAAGAGKTWDSGPLAPGASYSVAFGEVGSYAYACALHPEMKGTVEVVPTGP